MENGDVNIDISHEVKLPKHIKGDQLLDTRQLGLKNPVIKAGFLRIASSKRGWKYNQKPMSYLHEIPEWGICQTGSNDLYEENLRPTLKTEVSEYSSTIKTPGVFRSMVFYTIFLSPS